MDNLFIVHTPYHLVLATGIAYTEYNQNYRNFLIISKDFDTENLKLESLKKVFFEIFIIEGDYNSKEKFLLHNFKNINIIFKNLKEIKNLTTTYNFSNLFIANDFKVIDKKAMQLTNRGNECKIIYIEDGLAAYTSRLITNDIKKNRNKWKMKTYLYKLGEYGYIVNVLGVNNKIDECRVLFPNLVRHEFQKKIVKEIKKEQFQMGITTVYEDYLLKENDFNDSVIIFLDYSKAIDSQKEKYIETLKFIIENYRKLEMNIYLKYHPREKNFYLNFLNEQYETINFIEQNIPSEVLLYHCNDNVHVISNVSTCLLSVNKISHNIVVISLMEILEIKDPYLNSVFRKFNIFLPKDIEEVNKFIKQKLA